ncbi:cytochrome P450 [Ustulina deusta]|nr:cytochrome P450 [Ustulina deusta]
MEAIVIGTALAAGVLSHVAYFRIGEHHLYGTRYVFAAVVALAMSTLAHSYLLQTPVPVSVFKSLSLGIYYLGGLYASLVVYRIFFHPLRHFSGPLYCRISSVWFATYLQKHDAFRQLRKLHQTHGSFLRIGSNDLSISHPKAVQAIYGLGTQCRKADFYDLTYPMISLQSTRDGSIHGQRRRVWSTAFGDKNLRAYEKRMENYRVLLVNAIEQSGGRPMDVAKWFNLYSFDVMGDLAFGTSFKMLETSKEHSAIKLLTSGLEGLSYKLPMWFFRIMTSIPALTRDWWGFIGYCVGQLENRMKKKVDTPDIMTVLLKSTEDHDLTKLERTLLEGDAQLIVVAGSDTTSTTLTTVFRFLAQYPHHVGLLRAELDGLPRTELGNYVPSDLANLPHLNGIINESLRLFPPVATSLPRLTPPEGLNIEGIFVPGNVTVICPQYVLGRNPECYAYPDDFIPERWYSRPELLRDVSGFAPFSVGHYGCIGKPLALLNLRATICRIIADYDIKPTAREILKEYDESMAEHFTLVPSPLKLSFTNREVSGPTNNVNGQSVPSCD